MTDRLTSGAGGLIIVVFITATLIILLNAPPALSVENSLSVLGDVVGNGNAEMKAAFNRWVSVAGKAFPLFNEATLRTGEGMASIILRDGALMEIGKKTELKVNGSHGSYTVAVSSGILGFNVPRGMSFYVATPLAAIQVQMAEGSFQKAAFTSKENIRGVVICSPQGTKVISVSGSFMVRDISGTASHLLTAGNAVYVTPADGQRRILPVQLSEEPVRTRTLAAAAVPALAAKPSLSPLEFLAATALVEGMTYAIVDNRLRHKGVPSPSNPQCRISPCLKSVALK